MFILSEAGQKKTLMSFTMHQSFPNSNGIEQNLRIIRNLTYGKQARVFQYESIIYHEERC